MKKSILPVLLPALLAVFLLSGCNTGKPRAESTVQPVGGTRQDVVYFMAGKIETDEKVDITSKITAKVAGINIDAGSIVKKGDLLVKLDSKDLEAQSAQAKAAVSTAQANLDKIAHGARSEQILQAQAAYDNAKGGYDRIKVLFDQGGASKQQLESAELSLTNAKEQLNILGKGSPDDLKVAESQLKQAQAALDASNVQLGNSTILSPLSGIVSTKNINAGELAVAGVPLLTVVNAESLLVNAYLPSALLDKIEPGREVVIKVSEIPGTAYAGEIAAIDSVVDSKSKNVLVRIRFKNQDTQLKPGMFAEVGLKN